MREINYTEMKELIKIEPVIIIVGNESCGVCKVLKMKIEDIANRNDIVVYYIDYEKNKQISGEYSILSIPIILFLIEGKEYLRESRYINLAEFEEKIKRYKKLHSR